MDPIAQTLSAIIPISPEELQQELKKIETERERVKIKREELAAEWKVLDKEWIDKDQELQRQQRWFTIQTYSDQDRRDAVYHIQKEREQEREIKKFCSKYNIQIQIVTNYDRLSELINLLKEFI